MFWTEEKIDSVVLAAIVQDAIRNGWTMKLRIRYIQLVLPKHYSVKESKQKGNIHCSSSIGIDDEEIWGYFMNSLKLRFDDFSEVFHNTCYNHVDFTVYFRSVGKKKQIHDMSLNK